jgi:hypothetical protein
MIKKFRIIGLLFALPASLWGQTPEQRIEATTRRLTELNLPTSPIELRVAEGRAKGVPLDRIAAAVERRAEALVSAAAVLRASTSNPSVPELAAGADAIEGGIPTSALQQVIQGARAEDRPVALSVLTYLHRERGLPVDQALARVTEALREGPEALRSLPTGAGRPPEQARGAAVRGAAPGGGPPVNAPGPPPGRGPPENRGGGKGQRPE